MTDGDSVGSTAGTASNGSRGGDAGAGCPACGDEIDVDQRFCENCGHALQADGAAASTAGGPAAAPAGTTTGSGGPNGSGGSEDSDGSDGSDRAPATGLTSFGSAAAPPSPAGAAAASLSPSSPGAPASTRATRSPGSRGRAAGAVSCAACAGEIGDDGYCDECGRRAAVGADHVEDVLAAGPTGAVAAAGISDRGHRRRRNEDAFAFGRATTPDGSAAAVLVVADGVASVPHGDMASRVACDAAVSAGCEALAEGDDLAAAGAYAAAVARNEVAALAGSDGSPPACTYVAAVVSGADAVVDWVGDSRAYWLAPTGESTLLTEDDSWATEMVSAGLITADDAFTDPRAHVITRWLAADAPAVEARSVRCRLEQGGALLLCSDGVWNHVADPAVLAAVLGPSWLPDDVHAGARALVQAALDDGGTDNATAVLLAVGPSSTAEEEQ